MLSDCIVERAQAIHELAGKQRGEQQASSLFPAA
jgi:hypothetical protein